MERVTIKAASVGSERLLWMPVAGSYTAGLARYKHPRACLTIAQIPRSLQGKVQRARVREMVLARYALTDGPYPQFAPR